MGGKQSGHNDISPIKLNSIHHKVVINTNRVEMIDSTGYNKSCNCEMRWDGDADGADVGDGVDDDLDDARDDDDGDDLPFWEVISPAESARRRWLFSSLGFCSMAAEERRKDSPFRVYPPGVLYRRKGASRGATRQPGVCLAGPGGGPRQAPFWLPGGSPHLLPW